MALTCTKLGINEEAIRSLETVAEARLALIVIVAVEPNFAPLRPNCASRHCYKTELAE
jgi:hypothetical protein